jgi:biopolymer transport protein ExbB/TolQ
MVITPALVIVAQGSLCVYNGRGDNRAEVTFAHKIAALDAVKRASKRSAAIAHGEMKRGLNSLASIAAAAPFIS